MGKQGILLASILLVSGLIIYLWESPDTLLGGDTRKMPGDTNQKRPYAIVNNASTRHYNNEGILDYTFEASSLEYFRAEGQASSLNEDENYTLINQPKFIIFHGGDPWLVEADEGKFTEQNRRLLLWDNVIVSQAGGAGLETTLTTEKLEIKPEEKYAYTKEPVKIVSPSGDLTATGMIANFAEKQITLLSGVQGTYEPF